MKIIYISSARMPTEKAHGLQIMKMCEALASETDIELWIPRRSNYIKKNPFEYYTIKRNFRIRKIPCVDFVPLDKFLGPLSLWLTELSFLFFASIYFLGVRGDAIYTRDKFAVFFLSFLKSNIFYEAHTMIPRLFFRRVKKVKGIISISRYIRESFINCSVTSGKILVAPDGVDLTEFGIKTSKEECRKRLDLPLNERIVLYTGHLYPWKGTDTLLEAARKSTTLFVFVGGMENDVAEFRRNVGGLRNVRVIGHRPHAEIPYWLKAADVLVLPNSAKYAISKYWTSPLKLFEYMASGVPVVATDLPSLREVLDRNNAFLSKPDNAEELRRGIERVFSDSGEAHRLADNAKRAVRNFSWNIRAERILDFIRRSI